MRNMRIGLKYGVIFLSVLILLTGTLVLAAMIPRAAIEKNMLRSAEFLAEDPLFGTAVEGIEGSRIDRYADAILLAIAWQYDGASPLKSVMESSYYYSRFQNENENFLEAVVYDLPANQQYLRYWHGSNAIVRPLLCVLDLPQIYGLNAAVMGVLVLWLLALLIKKGAVVPALGVGLGLVVTASWFVPLSLEYTWTYLLMLAGAIFAVKLGFAGKWQCLKCFFLVLGMLTSYLDFLTTETLPLLVPLLLVLWIAHRTEEGGTGKFAGKAVLLWGCGYVGMWVCKWLLASWILGENVLPYVAGHVQERLSGDLGLNRVFYLFGAVVRNIGCLFPVGYGPGGVLAAVAMGMVASGVGYVYRKKEVRRDRIAVFAVLGLVPYVRYLVVHNHSWLHCFFTYRAQLATVLAVVLLLEELTDWRWRTHENAGKRKP